MTSALAFVHGHLLAFSCCRQSAIPSADFDFDKVSKVWLILLLLWSLTIILVGLSLLSQVFPSSANQSDVYVAAVRPIVEDVLAGYNGTVMAYGQTGAGKTHTLSCVKPDTIGAVPRAIAEVFKGISKDGPATHTILMSYVQIYMELIQVRLEVARYPEPFLLGAWIEVLFFVTFKNSVLWSNCICE